MAESEKELVEGISRFHEMLWLIRDESGRILQVFDREGNSLPLKSLHRSFITVAVPGGFTYKGEFIAMENESREFKRLALQRQRRKRNHPPKRFLS